MEQGVAAASINIDTFLAYQRAHFPSPANLKTENENGVGGMYSMPAYQVPYPLHNNGSFPALPKPDPDIGNHQNFQGFNPDADANASDDDLPPMAECDSEHELEEEFPGARTMMVGRHLQNLRREWVGLKRRKRYIRNAKLSSGLMPP